MRRTRKWEFVKQEATRLAGLGLSPRDIAKRLELSKSTVTRWMASGKLRRLLKGPPPEPVAKQTPAEWAEAVRKNYALDVTDEQLVTLAESALAMSQNPTLDSRVKLAASGRFQTLVRQLSLVARAADQEPQTSTPASTRRTNPSVRRPAADPRGHLRAV